MQKGGGNKRNVNKELYFKIHTYMKNLVEGIVQFCYSILLGTKQ